MIDISLYSKFQNDLKTNYLNIHAFIVIGWDRNDTTRHQFGSPNEDSIFLSEKKELFDGDYYDDVDIRIPAINESFDFDRGKYKINNISLNLDNRIIDGERFSNRLEDKKFVNEQVVIFWKSQTCETLSDCFPVYLGIIRKLIHDDKKVKISLEDYSQFYLDVDVPINAMPTDNFVKGEERGRAIPMVHGNVDAHPVRYSVGEPHDDGTVNNVNLYVESKRISDTWGAFTINYKTFTNNSATNVQEGLSLHPVLIGDKGKYYNTRQHCSSDCVADYNYHKDNWNTDSPRVGFRVDPADLQDSTSSELQSNRISQTSEDKVRIFQIMRPTKISIKNRQNIGSASAIPVNQLNSYANEGAHDSQSPDPIFNQERALEFHPDTMSFGDYNANTGFVELNGWTAPRSYFDNRYATTALEFSFPDNMLPYSSSRWAYVMDPLILGYFRMDCSSRADFTINHGIPFSYAMNGSYMDLTASSSANFNGTFGRRHTWTDGRGYNEIGDNNLFGLNQHFSSSGVPGWPYVFTAHTNDYYGGWKLGYPVFCTAENEDYTQDVSFNYAPEQKGIMWARNDTYYSSGGSNWDSFTPVVTSNSNSPITDSDNAAWGSTPPSGGSLELTQYPNARWRSSTFNNVSSFSWANTKLEKMIWDSPRAKGAKNSKFLRLSIGGQIPFANWLYFDAANSSYQAANAAGEQSFNGIQQFLVYHKIYIRVYNLHYAYYAEVSDLANMDWYMRINKGRLDMQGSHDTGLVWVMRNIARTEFDANWVDYDSYSVARALEQNDYSTDEIAFSVEDRIGLKKLYEDMCRSGQFFTKFRYDGKYHFTYIKRKYTNSDVVGIIKASDAFRYSFKRSDEKNIKTKVNLEYHYDYGAKDYKASMTDSVDNYSLNAGGTTYKLENYGLESPDANGNETHNKSTLKFESDYIRSRHIWEMCGFATNFDFNNTDGTTKDDGYATQFIKYKVLSSCQQKLVISCELPLSYLWVETGDVVRFDGLLGEITAYGHDYTKLKAINGMWCYPAFMCTKISKSLDKVKCEFTQLWYLNDNDNHGWDISDEVTEEELELIESTVYGCTDPEALNYNPNATEDNGTCVLPGDPNGDGLINVVDVVYIVNHIFGIATIPSSQWAASDINGDGFINIVDVVGVVNMVLGTNIQVEVDGCTDPNATNYNPSATNDDGSCTYPVNACTIPNANNYVADTLTGEYVADDSLCDFIENVPAHWWVIENDYGYNPQVARISQELDQYDRHDTNVSYPLHPATGLSGAPWTIQDRFESQDFFALKSLYDEIRNANGISHHFKNSFINVWRHKYTIGHPLGWEGGDFWREMFYDMGLNSEYNAAKNAFFGYAYPHGFNPSNPSMSPNILAIYSIPELYELYTTYLDYPEFIQGTNIGLNELLPYKDLINLPRPFNEQTTGQSNEATHYNINKSVIQGSLTKNNSTEYSLHNWTWGNTFVFGATCSIVVPLDMGTLSEPINYKIFFDELRFDEWDDSFEVIVMRFPGEDISSACAAKADFNEQLATYGFKTITSFAYTSFTFSNGSQSSPWHVSDGNGNSSSVLAHSFYNVSEVYDGWGNSLNSSETMPALEFSFGSFVEEDTEEHEQVPSNNIVIHIIYHGSSPQQWCTFKHPRIERQV